MKKLSVILLLFFGFVGFSTAQTVTIGNQVWMTKNLNVDKFRNGDPILEVKTDEEWLKAGENKQPAWCYYNNDPANGEKYGKLYNWYAVNDPRGLAPIGYHIPSDDEWTTLVGVLGRDGKAGNEMKSKNGWSSEGNGTNSSGFSGLPGGSRSSYDGSGRFYGVGESGNWWSSTESRPTINAWMTGLYSGSVGVGSSSVNQEEGNSVRCIKD
jgi:hypothetical protein